MAAQKKKMQSKFIQARLHQISYAKFVKPLDEHLAPENMELNEKLNL